MEALMTLVMKYCSKELEDYAACVAAKPETWNRDCEDLKNKAANCSSHSPAVKKINKVCAKEYIAYENCLSANPSTVENCVDQLQNFLECAEAAARTIPIIPQK